MLLTRGIGDFFTYCDKLFWLYSLCKVVLLLSFDPEAGADFPTKSETPTYGVGFSLSLDLFRGSLAYGFV